MEDLGKRVLEQEGGRERWSGVRRSLSELVPFSDGFGDWMCWLVGVDVGGEWVLLPATGSTTIN